MSATTFSSERGPAVVPVPWSARWSRGRGLLPLVAFALAYLAGAELAWQAFGASSPGFAFFPPAGVSLAALVVAPRRRWPAILLTIVVVEGFVDRSHGLAPGATALYVLANAVEPFVGASAFLRATDGRRDLDTRRDFVTFCATACVFAPMVGGLVGLAGQAVEGETVSLVTWLQWVAGDGVAVLAIGAPIVLLVRHPGLLARRRLELAALCACTAATGWALFRLSLPPFLPILPFVAWGAFRLGRVGIAVTGAVFALVMSWMTAAGYDMFDGLTLDPVGKRALTQIYLAVLLIVLWLVAFAVEERLGALRDALSFRVERDEAQAVSDALQRAVSPSASGRVGDFRIGAWYAPAERIVGGDWYDALALDGGAVYFAIGDVVGHGLAAVDDMTQLRYAARTLALEGHGPARIVAGLSRLTSAATDGGFATTAVAVFDPRTATMRYAGAGHPPLFVRRACGAVEAVGATGPPLGVDPMSRWVEAPVRVSPGDVFVMCTDGLIERRGLDLDRGIAEMVTVMGRAMAEADLVAACRSVIDGTLTDYARHDDTCVLAFRYAPNAEDAHTVGVAVPSPAHA